jgi:[NiFe] hydrogenase assembly HybE family chaperone
MEPSVTFATAPVSVKDHQADLYDAFRRADARMFGLPVYNSALQVELRGFQEWSDQSIGVLITPWCMNLILLPTAEMDDGARSAWQTLRQGQEVDHVLPCGKVRFTVGDDGSGGRYQMCSLFSPMDDFSDQDSAQQVADQTLAAVLTDPHASVKAPKPPPEVSRRDLFRGLRAASARRAEA